MLGYYLFGSNAITLNLRVYHRFSKQSDRGVKNVSF